jgi:hypothetical protein
MTVTWHIAPTGITHSGDPARGGRERPSGELRNTPNRATVHGADRRDVKGQFNLPVGGQWFCPLVATSLADSGLREVGDDASDRSHVRLPDLVWLRAGILDTPPTLLPPPEGNSGVSRGAAGSSDDFHHGR